MTSLSNSSLVVHDFPRWREKASRIVHLNPPYYILSETFSSAPTKFSRLSKGLFAYVLKSPPWGASFSFFSSYYVR